MQKCKILLIDDDIEDYLIIREAFDEIGSSTAMEHAGNGEKGFAILEREYLTHGSLPELIVLDINMPVLDGPSFLRLMRADERFREIPVVIYSTAIHPNDELKCKELGVLRCMTKPTTLEEIVAVGNTFLTLCELKTIDR